MCEISKQVQVTHIISILMSFLPVFFLKTTLFLCLFFFPHFQVLVLLSIFTFWYYIKYLRNMNWEALLLAKLGKLHLPQNF